MKSLVSIIVPVYNNEKYLSECISSILNQTLEDIQLILVNDGSTDGSLAICKYFEVKDHRVKVIDKKNEGVSSARNDGIDAAIGDYIGFVDSDDTISPSLYEVLVRTIQEDHSQCAVLAQHTVREKNAKLLNVNVISGQEAVGMLLKLQFPCSLWAYLYRRETIAEQRLRQDIHFFEDFEFNFRILLTCKAVSLCAMSLYNYRVNCESINAQGANNKRLSCLLVPDCIDDVTKSDVQLKGKRISHFYESYFIVSVISPLRLPLRKDEFVYIKFAQQHVRQVWLRLLASKATPYRFKALLIVAALDLRFVIFFRSILRGFRSRG